jgi:hypothetical protein
MQICFCRILLLYISQLVQMCLLGCISEETNLQIFCSYEFTQLQIAHLLCLQYNC